MPSRCWRPERPSPTADPSPPGRPWAPVVVRVLLALLAPAIVAGSTMWVGPAGAGAGIPGTGVVLHLSDPRIDEASGLAIGRRSPGVLYVANDSGDANRIFAVDRRTGRTAATISVRGARNLDWEDLAVADDAHGTPSIWIADTGDNAGARPEVQVYRIDEPRIGAGGDRNRTVVSARADVWRLRYPGGARDAESLAVAPGGAAYLISKSLLGRSVVYRLPPHPDPARRQPLAPVARIDLTPTGTANPFGLAGQLAATGAAFSRDATVFALRTYSDAYLWPVTRGDLRRALRGDPERVPLSEQRQGEGIAVEGPLLLLDSEGRHSAIRAVRRPPLAEPGRPPAARPTPDETPPPPSSPTPQTVAAPAQDHLNRAVAAAVVTGAAALLVVGWWRWRAGSGHVLRRRTQRARVDVVDRRGARRPGGTGRRRR